VINKTHSGPPHLPGTESYESVCQVDEENMEKLRNKFRVTAAHTRKRAIDKKGKSKEEDHE
jgi:hypothetical protein